MSDETTPVANGDSANEVQGLTPRVTEAVVEVQGLEPKSAPAVEAILVEGEGDASSPES